MATIHVRFWQRSDQVMQDGSFAMYLIIKEGSKQKRYSLGMSARKEDWSNKEQRFLVKGFSRKEKELAREKQKVYDLIDRLAYENRLTFDNLIKAYEKKETRTLFEYWEYCIRLWNNEGEKRAGTMKHYVSRLTVLRGYKDTPLAAIDEEYLNGLHTFLRKRELGEGTLWTYHKAVKAVLNQAVKEQELARNPYQFWSRKVKSPTPTEKVFLTHAEVGTLLDLLKQEILNPHEQNVLHFFLIGCFTGMRYSEWSNVERQLNSDELEFVVRQLKTDKVVRLPKHEILAHLLSWKTDTLHKISDQKAREYLLKVMKVAGIEKHVTTHTARHTFAMMMLNDLDAPLEMVSECLGHSSVNVTRKHYARYLFHSKQKTLSKFDTLFKDHH